MKCRTRALERDAQNTNGFGIEFATLKINSDRHLPSRVPHGNPSMVLVLFQLLVPVSCQHGSRYEHETQFPFRIDVGTTGKHVDGMDDFETATSHRLNLN